MFFYGLLLSTQYTHFYFTKKNKTRHPLINQEENLPL